MPTPTVDIDNRRVAVAVRAARFAAKAGRPATSCPYSGDGAEETALRRVWLATYLRARPPAAGTVDYTDDEMPVVEAERAPEHDPQNSREQEVWAAAVAALAAHWPATAAPLVDELARTSTTGALAGLTVSAKVTAALASALLPPMVTVAGAGVAAATMTAAAQGVATGLVTPDLERLRELAAVTASLIAAGYASVATRAALSAPAGRAGAAVREALVELGHGPAPMVAAHLRALLTAALHLGRRAVYLAFPPAYFVADESHEDANRCAACAEADGRRYDTLAQAEADYPGFGGFRSCAGGFRCRGGIRGVWRRSVTESARPMPVALAEPGAVI